jgi:hypothetical protein
MVSYKGVNIPQELAVAMKGKRTRDERDALFERWALKNAEIYAQPGMDEPKIPDAVWDEGQGKWVSKLVSAREFRSKYPDRPMPAAVAQPSATTTKAPADTLSAIKTGIFNQESLGGKLDTSKPNYAGAVGPMQILPDTFEGLKKEGLIPQNYDINNPQHNKAAGDALIDKYYKQYKGDPDKVMAAYYGGPGAIKADGTIDVNRRDPRNPNAPTVGEYIAQAKQKAGLTTVPAEVARPSKPVSVQALQKQEEIEQKGLEAKEVATGTATGKYFAGKETTLVEAKDTAQGRLASIDNIENLVINPKTNRVFGVFEKPGFWNGVGNIVQSGIKVGRLGDVGIGNLDKLVVANMKGASQEEINAAQIATREFAKMQLDEAKILLAGQGAVSDAERQLIKELTGSRLNSPGAIQEYLTWGRMRAQFDDKIGELYDQWKGANPNGNFEKFRVSPEARQIRSDYNKQMLDFAAQKGIKVGAKSEQSSQPKPQWSHSDSDYDAWKKSKGLK